MKKLLLSAAALCCFVSAHAQWSPGTHTSTTEHSYRLGKASVGSDEAPDNQLYTFLVRPTSTTGAGGMVIGHPLTGSGGFTSLMLGVTARSGGYSTIHSISRSGFGDGMGNIFFDCRNIGIGTTSPLTKLHVVGTVSVQDNLRGRLLFYDNGGAHLGYSVRMGAGGGLAWQLVDGSNNSFFHVDYPTGNAGIGTATPQFKLDVVGRARFQAANGTAGFWLSNLANTTNRAFIGMMDDNAVGLWGGNFWGLTMDVNNGTVTVGTPAPTGARGSYKLDVWGRARANEIVVNTSGADFVFEDNYRLRSLKEVEQFITANNHLPEIPSAQEMQQNGMAVGELQTKLLQKVEELTLYLIEQNQKLEDQHNQLQELKKENQELKKKLED